MSKLPKIQELIEVLEKGRKALPIGTEKVWNGIRYRKDGMGKWLPVTDHKQEAKKEEPKDSPKTTQEHPQPNVENKKEDSSEMALKQASEMGMQAFKEGKMPVPSQNKQFMEMYKKQYGKIDGIQLMQNYLDGWHKANLKAPIPEPKSTEAEPTQLTSKEEQRLKYLKEGGLTDPNDPHVGDAIKQEVKELSGKKANAPQAENMRTESLSRLAIPYSGRVKIDGKPSDIPYEPIPDSKSNMIGFVAFGKASKKAQKELNEMLQGADKIMNAIGFKFKTPLDFVCQSLATGRDTQAQYVPLDKDNPRVNIVARDSGITKSLMHEIGHAIDYALESVDNKSLRTRNTKGRMGETQGRKDVTIADPIKQAFSELSEVVNNSEYYQKAPDSRKSYLKTPTEVFARAFEVYAFSKAQELVKSGELPKSFIEKYRPDVFKEKDQNLEKVVEAGKSVLKEIGEFDRQTREISNTLWKESVKELGLSEKDLPNRGMYSEVLGENFSKVQKLAREKELSDPKIKELTEKNKEARGRLKDLQNTETDIRKENGGYVLVPEEQQKAYSDKIGKLMDKIFKMDPVKKALDFMGLIETLQKSVEKEPPPFYSSVVVVSPDETKILLGKRRDKEGFTCPAGGANLNETPRQTAIRELFEEALISAQPEQLVELNTKHLANGKCCHCFMLILKEIPETITNKLDPDKELDSKGWRWFSITESLPEPLSDNRRETLMFAINKLMERKKAEDAFFRALNEKIRRQTIYDWALDPRTQFETVEDISKPEHPINNLIENKTLQAIKHLKKSLDLISLNNLLKGGVGSGQKGHFTPRKPTLGLNPTQTPTVPEFKPSVPKSTSKPFSAPKEPTFEPHKEAPTIESLKSHIDSIVEKRQQAAVELSKNPDLFKEDKLLQERRKMGEEIVKLNRILADMVDRDPKYAFDSGSAVDFDVNDGTKTQVGQK